MSEVHCRVSGLLIVSVGPSAVVTIKDGALLIDSKDNNSPNIVLSFAQDHALVLDTYANLVFQGKSQDPLT